jgi:hypothetical protein
MQLVVLFYVNYFYVQERFHRNTSQKCQYHPDVSNNEINVCIFVGNILTIEKRMLPGTHHTPSMLVYKTPFLKTLYGLTNTITKNKFIKNRMVQTIFYRPNYRRILHHCNVINNESKYSWGTENHKGVYQVL